MKIDLMNGVEYEDVPFSTQRVLFKVLQGKIKPTDVEILLCRGDSGISYSDKQQEQYDELARDAAELKPLIHQAILDSPWIDTANDAQIEEWISKIAGGSNDAALCVLVPLLVNLRKILLPWEDEYLVEVVERIAKTSLLPATPEPRPLGNLVLVESTLDSNGEYGFSFQDVAPYAALPSVRRLVMRFVRTGKFEGWPADLPLSHASEVFLLHSDVRPGEVSKFAQCFVGPCKMWQNWFVFGDEDGGHDPEWDHLELGTGGTRIEWRDDSGQLCAGIERGTRPEKIALVDGSSQCTTYLYGHPATEYSPVMNDMINYDQRLFDWRDV